MYLVIPYSSQKTKCHFYIIFHKLLIQHIGTIIGAIYLTLVSIIISVHFYLLKKYLQIMLIRKLKITLFMTSKRTNVRFAHFALLSNFVARSVVHI